MFKYYFRFALPQELVGGEEEEEEEGKGNYSISCTFYILQEQQLQNYRYTFASSMKPYATERLAIGA